MKKQHTCETCNATFSRNINLLRHVNKLRKCNIVTDFLCEWCNHSFSNNSSLTRHISSCKTKRNHDKLEQTIQDETNKTNDRFENLESKCKMLESKLVATTTITSLNESSVSANANINGNSNTNSPTTHSHNPVSNSHNNNHVIINNYGSEDLSHIKLKQITLVFSKSFMSVIECVKLKHFSPLAPHNRNVVIKDIKSKHAYIFCDGNWDIVGRTNLIDEMYETICDYLEEKLNKLRNELDERVITLITNFLHKQYDDKISNDIKDELGMLLFNKRDRL